MGSPDDEYDPEVEEMTRWREPVTAKRVAEVFTRWFGQGSQLTADAATQISQGINAARAAHQPQRD